MSTRLDDANRSFAWLLALALAPYALAAMAGCLLFTVVLGRLLDGGVGALAAGPGDLRPAVAFLVTLATATAVAGFSLRTQLRATRRLAARVAALSTPPPDTMTAAAAHARLAGRVDVVDTPEPLSFAYGLRAPRVAVSVGLLDHISADELAAVLAHERYHVTNLDPAKVVIARALSAGLFFLPALRGLLGRYRAGRELAADRTAIRAHGPTALTGALYRVAAGPAWPELATAAALGGPDLLEARVDQLETGREPPADPIPLAALGATAVALALLAAALLVPLASLGGPAALMGDMMADQTMDSTGFASGIWWCALPLVAAAVAVHRYRTRRP